MDKRKLNRITAVFLTLLVLVVAFMLSGSFRRTSRSCPRSPHRLSKFPASPVILRTY